MVTIKGQIITGVLRGTPLIEKYFYRLVSILGFEPFRGTMDVKLERSIDLRLYATKEISHLLMDGSKHMDAILAPVKLRFNGRESDCWTIRQFNCIHGNDVIEIIGKDCFKEKYGMKDGNVIELEFAEIERPRRIDKLKKLKAAVSKKKK